MANDLLERLANYSSGGGTAPNVMTNFGPGGLPITPQGPQGQSGGGIWDALGGILSNTDWLGSTNAQTGMTTPGVLPTAVSSLSGLSDIYFGLKQYGLAKDQFRENRRQFNLNFDAQRNLTNSQLEDRQKARVASNPGRYESVSSYMNKYKVGG